MTAPAYLTLAAALLLITVTGASAQTPAPAEPAVAEDAFAQARLDLQADMAKIKATGDIDKDFINNMIPQHKAAVAMAEIASKTSKDTVTRRLAQNIIGTQKAAIKQMEARLKQLEK